MHRPWIITKLFMSLEARPMCSEDADEFFKYKNQHEPPSLSDRGKLRSRTKSDILGCLSGMPGPGRTQAAREASVVVLDMAAVRSPYHQAPAGQRVWGIHRNAIAALLGEPR